VLVDKFSLE